MSRVVLRMLRMRLGVMLGMRLGGGLHVLGRGQRVAVSDVRVVIGFVPLATGHVRLLSFGRMMGRCAEMLGR